jgi:hypothetical protein
MKIVTSKFCSERKLIRFCLQLGGSARCEQSGQLFDQDEQEQLQRRSGKRKRTASIIFGRHKKMIINYSLFFRL